MVLPATSASTTNTVIDEICVTEYGSGVSSRLHKGGARPDITAHLQAAAQKASRLETEKFGAGGPPVIVAVVVCGLPAVVDEVYAFTEKSEYRGNSNISERQVRFHVHHETFNL